MATSPWYREGIAKFTEGSTTVTGTDTEWAKFVRAGDGIQGPDGKLYQVTNVASNTSLSITPAYGSATTYWTIPIQGYVKQLADSAAQLVRDFEGVAAEAFDAADRAKQSANDAGNFKELAQVAASEAKASETAAKVSQDAAKASQTASKASEDSAKASATTATTKATEASTSATNASNSAAAAKTSETNSKASETAAAASASKAMSSETAARTSEVNAKASETIASTKATQATNEAAKAKTEADRAETEADRAQTLKSETEALYGMTSVIADEVTELATSFALMQKQIVDADWVIPSGYNALVIGDLNVNPGVTVTGVGSATLRGI